MRATLMRVLVMAALCAAVAGVRADQAPQQPAPEQPARQGGGGGRGGPPQGGAGPIKVMFVTKGHAYDREGLALMLDALGKDISWSHVEHPAVTTFFEPRNAELFDVFLLDRKSTRLNSSHLVISYAVFCLKKKKKRSESHN